MNLEDVVHNLSARQVLGAVETRALAGVAAVLSKIAENLSHTAESRLAGVSCRKRQRNGLWARFRKQSEN